MGRLDKLEKTQQGMQELAYNHGHGETSAGRDLGPAVLRPARVVGGRD